MHEENSSIPPFKTPKGTHDILPSDHTYFTYIKKVVRHRCRQGGFKRISTPMFEYTEVFTKGIGKETDIVDKEMFTFSSKSGKSYSLRPENTAPVVRAYIEHHMKELPQPVELYYIEPQFRYDRPQKGRYRQFYQFGFEAIGEKDAAIDAQIIQIADQINKDLKISGRLNLQLNTIGCPICRKDYIEDIVNFYTGKERSLCENCKKRLKLNPLRLLDCKEEDCAILASLAPKFIARICAECKEAYEDLKEYLNFLNIAFVENPKIVRGLDYYTKTVFEFWDKSLGAQNAIGGGGRYDGLVELLGGAPAPAVGYAAGMERIIEHMKANEVKVPHKDYISVFVAQLGKAAKKKCLQLLTELRNDGIHAVGAVGEASIKSQMGRADKFKAKYAVIMGQIEVKRGEAIIRDMEKGKQENVKYEDVIKIIKKRVGKENIDTHNFWE